MSGPGTGKPADRRWYLLLVPLFAVLSVVAFYPLLYGIYLSLTGAGGGLTLANYSQMVSEAGFWGSATTSLAVSALGIIFELCLGLALTFLLLQAARWRRLFEAVFLAPLAMAPIAVGIVWAPSTVWDDFQTFTHLILGLPYFNELSAAFYIPVMSLSEAWEWAPLVMLVSIGIINSTPKEVYDAAGVSGASAWQAFRDVAIPSILRSPVMQFVMVLQFVGAMWAFEIPLAWSSWLGFSTSAGSPADTLSLFLYKLLFIPSFGRPIHLVSAMAVALLVLTLAGAAAMVRLLARIGSSGFVSSRRLGRAGGTSPGGRSRRLGGRALLYLAFLVATLYSLFPPIAMASDAAGANIAALFAIIGGAPFTHSAFFVTPVYYRAALAALPSRALNSLAVAALSVGAALAVGVPASYVLARIDVRGKGAVSFVLFALKIVSPFAVVLPLYISFMGAGLWDTYQGVALAELLLVLTVMVWMVEGFFADIPRQVYDTASALGSSEWQVFSRVALPKVARGVAVAAVFGILLVWNEFLIAAVFAGPHTQTVAVGIWGQLGAGGSTPFVSLEAAATVAYLPALAVVLAIRKYLAMGFSLATAR